MTDQEQQEHDPKEQPLVAHLVELRDRILRSLLVILIIFLALFAFANDIYQFVASPLTDIMPEGTQMIATDVTSPFFAPFKLTLFTAFALAMPFILHQAWAFIAPGLYKNEVRLALPILLSSIVLFYLGIAFAYFVVLDLAFSFFTTIGPENVAIMTDISRYLDFVLLIFFAFGITFEIPVATVLLIISGAVEPQDLAKKRPYIIVGCFAVGMVLTPPDPFTQSLLAVPMWLLFEIGIIAGRLLKRKAEEAEEAEKAEETEEPETGADTESTDKTDKT